MRANSGVKAYAVDDGLGIQPFGFRVSVQLIEVGHTKCQIGIGKQFHSLGFGKAHEQGVDIRFQCSLLEKGCESMCGFSTGFITGYNDAGRIQIIIQSLGFPQEFRAENDVLGVILGSHGCSISHRDGGLDDHHGVGIGFQHQLNNRLHCGGVEEVLLAVVVGGGGNDDKIRVPVGAFGIQRCGQVKLLFCQIFFNIVVLNGRNVVIDFLYLLRDNIHSNHMVVLSQKCG